MDIEFLDTESAHTSHKSLWIVEPERLDGAQVVADVEAIRHYSPVRYEMEHLTAIICEDPARHVCAGYKDLAVNEFWTRGAGSESPVMPPLLMCEAAAQLSNYYARKYKLYPVQGFLLGFDRVRCHGSPRPGERLVIMTKLLKVRRTLVTCQFQCAVGNRLLCEGIVIGGASADQYGPKAE